MDILESLIFMPLWCGGVRLKFWSIITNISDEFKITAYSEKYIFYFIIIIFYKELDSFLDVNISWSYKIIRLQESI